MKGYSNPQVSSSTEVIKPMLSHISLSSFFVSKIVSACCCVVTAPLSLILEQLGEGNKEKGSSFFFL
jgi:hypothetical protein